MKKRAYDSALREGLPPEVVKKLWIEWQESEKLLAENNVDKENFYRVNGFEHPPLFTILKDEDYKATRNKWGLIPSWVKDEAEAAIIQNKTLNARGETIFVKPAFKESAIKNRCLIVVDGFFEHYHFKGKTFPYFIQHKSKELPLVFGGLAAEWCNQQTGEIFNTATIITTEANELMAKIHNNPKANGSRMPLILEPKNFEEWLNSNKPSKIKELIKPFHHDQLLAFTVGKLNGKNAIPNSPDSILEKVYPELTVKELFD